MYIGKFHRCGPLPQRISMLWENLSILCRSRYCMQLLTRSNVLNCEPERDANIFTNIQDFPVFLHYKVNIFIEIYTVKISLYMNIFYFVFHIQNCMSRFLLGYEQLY